MVNCNCHILPYTTIKPPTSSNHSALPWAAPHRQQHSDGRRGSPLETIEAQHDAREVNLQVPQQQHHGGSPRHGWDPKVGPQSGTPKRYELGKTRPLTVLISTRTGSYIHQ